MEPFATLNLANLLSGSPESYEVEGEGLLMPEEETLKANGLRLAEPLAWQLTVRSTGGDDDFIMDGSAEGVAIMDCRRCLDDVQVPLATDFLYPMMYRPGKEGLTLLESDEEEDTLVFGQPEVDFTNLITQVFAIDLPLTALCREDCKGLSTDGVNLNEHPELATPEPETKKPSPFAVLKDLEL